MPRNKLGIDWESSRRFHRVAGRFSECSLSRISRLVCPNLPQHQESNRVRPGGRKRSRLTARIRNARDAIGRRKRPLSCSPGCWWLLRDLPSIKLGHPSLGKFFARWEYAIRRRLGWKPGILNGLGNKPKGMHWRTFERLTSDHETFAERSLAGMMQWLGMTQRLSFKGEC